MSSLDEVDEIRAAFNNGEIRQAVAYSRVDSLIHSYNRSEYEVPCFSDKVKFQRLSSKAVKLKKYIQSQYGKVP